MKKYYFDQNNFDEPDDGKDDSVNEPPPPPSFTQEQLAAARDLAHETGKKAGYQDAVAEREQHIADLLQTISSSLGELFTAEEKRAQRYETEAVSLARDIFRQVFPVLHETGGLKEVMGFITTVLNRQYKQPSLRIEVHPDVLNPIKDHVKTIHDTLHAKGEFTVVSNDTLALSECFISWENGGAKRDITTLNAEIEKEIKEILADQPLLGDNNKQKTKETSPSDIDADDTLSEGSTAILEDTAENNPQEDPEENNI